MRTISFWSMYMREAVGESRSSCVVVASESGSQKCARSFGSLSGKVGVKVNGGKYENETYNADG
jgi:hypothetical protein